MSDPSERSVEKIAVELEDFMRKNELAQADVAQYVGLAESVISRILRRKVSSIHPSTLKRLRVVMPSRKLIPSEEIFVEKIFSPTNVNMLTLLAQEGREQYPVVDSIKLRAAALYEDVFDLSPPRSETASLRQYFTRLARQCGLENVGSPAGWEDALAARLERGDRLLLLIRNFEAGPDGARREFAGILRALVEKHRQARVILCGGEKLAEQKYAAGRMSLFSEADERIWPELTVPDVLDWQCTDFPEVDFNERAAEDLLEFCGGHPRLVRHYIPLWLEKTKPGPPEEGSGYEHFIWQTFARYQDDSVARNRICHWLKTKNFGPYQPWPPDSLLRRLYWSNLLTKREGQFQWRCDWICTTGKMALACE